MILFLASFPDSESIKEGMFQRIASIDSFYKYKKRAYLTVSFKSNLKKYHYIDGNLNVYHLNFFLHFSLILKLFRNSSKIYIHSLYNVITNIFFVYFTSKQIILDVHGVVPEEEEFKGNSLFSKILSFFERIIFNKSGLKVITVTEAMSDFYREKYRSKKFTSVNYCIFPAHLSTDLNWNPDNESGEKVNIVYSGNLQRWQNVELMLDIIKSKLDTNYHFYILTGDLDNMIKLVNEYIPEFNQKITILSLPPHELAQIYKICHYGFILRDDIVVNRVACPTKLIEYLHFGIVPIVLNENIGDFNTLGYEYLKLDNLNGLLARKSLKNISIITKLAQMNRDVEIGNI